MALSTAKHAGQIKVLRSALKCHGLETLRRLETEGGANDPGLAVDLILEALSLEIAERSAELIAAYRSNKVGACWPRDMNRERPQ